MRSISEGVNLAYVLVCLLVCQMAGRCVTTIGIVGRVTAALKIGVDATRMLSLRTSLDATWVTGQRCWAGRREPQGKVAFRLRARLI